MTCCERGDFIREKQIGPAWSAVQGITPEHNALAIAKITQADDPCSGGPASPGQSFRCRVVDRSTIAGEHSALCYGVEFSGGIDAVLQWHSEWRFLDHSSSW